MPLFTCFLLGDLRPSLAALPMRAHRLQRSWHRESNAPWHDSGLPCAVTWGYNQFILFTEEDTTSILKKGRDDTLVEHATANESDQH